jgi:hypothetical protein
LSALTVDGLDPPHRHAGQVHLDQRLLDRGLAPPVALDDRRLKGRLAQLGHLQGHLTGLRLQLATVAPGPRVLAGLRALVAPGLAHLVSLRIEQAVERLLDAAAHQLAQVILHGLLVDADDIRQHLGILALRHGGPPLGAHGSLTTPVYRSRGGTTNLD